MGDSFSARGVSPSEYFVVRFVTTSLAVSSMSCFSFVTFFWMYELSTLFSQSGPMDVYVHNNADSCPTTPVTRKPKPSFRTAPSPNQMNSYLSHFFLIKHGSIVYPGMAWILERVSVP